ncbi:MAG: tyrosine-type recombinase/integrase [Gammaproteobacteria bacterium]
MKLAQAVDNYIALKQAQGSRFHAEATILKAFCNALGDVAIIDVEPDPVTRYLAGSGPVTRHWHRKYEALTGFYRFALGRGYVLHSPLPMTVPKRPQPFRPYIYSQDELRDLLKATDEYETPRTALEGATLRTLLLLLYGAGLRIGEAVALTCTDVDLDAALLTICESKFYKTRLVPIGPQLTAVLRTYDDDRNSREHCHDPGAPFFVTRTGTAATRGQAERAFVRLRNMAGIVRKDGARYQPRLHDLRHHADSRIMPSYQQPSPLSLLFTTSYGR